MPTTIRNTDILFNDGTTQSTSAGVPIGGPAFSATDTATTATQNVFTKIIFDTTLFNVGSAFDGTKFQPTVAGYYQINGLLEVGNAPAAAVIFIGIFKNGVLFRGSTQAIAVGFGSSSAVISTTMHLNGSTDFIEFFGRNTATANFGVSAVSGFLARSAI